jgi:Ca2+-binding RTX toxin-like protein
VIGTAGNDVIQGSNHQATLIGGAGDDQITGGSGQDTIDPGTGLNTVDGGKGIDTITFASATSGVRVSLRANTATGTNINDTISHIENIRGSKFADTLIGDAKNNVITPGLGNDTVNGESGDDTIVASSTADGADNISGGAGIDTVTYAARHGSLHISLNKKANDGAKNEHDFIHKDVENVIGGSGNDTISGDSADNRLDGGPGINTLSVAGAPSAVAVNLTTHASKHWGTDKVLHFQNVIGSPHNDTITGNSNPNVLNGAGGNDVILGMAGPDFLLGGPGNDHLNGGPGNDRCSPGGGHNVLISC